MMRSLAVAQAWLARDERARATLLETEALPGLVDLARNGGVDVKHVAASRGTRDDAQATVAHVADIARRMQGTEGAAALVLDGYAFDDAYEAEVAACGARTLAFDDDGHASHAAAALVLNQSFGATRLPRYSKSARALLGPRYACLRPQFAEAGVSTMGTHAPPTPAPRSHNAGRARVAIVFGGTDFAGMIPRALAELAHLDVDVDVVAGAATTVVDPAPRVTVHRGLFDLAPVFRAAALVVTAAGSTCLELCALGVPFITVTVADNQRTLAQALDDAGIAPSLGWHASLAPQALADAVKAALADDEGRAARAARGTRSVDGMGARRVAQALADELFLRPATSSDAELVFTWANDPEARRVSFSSAPIPWDTHAPWFAARLEDPASLFFVVEDRIDHPVAQVRGQIEGDAATISVAVAPDARGKGYGARTVALGAEQLLWYVPRVNAFIKPDNERSLRTFAAAGFVDDGEADVRGERARRFIKTRRARSSTTS